MCGLLHYYLSTVNNFVKDETKCLILFILYLLNHRDELTNFIQKMIYRFLKELFS